MNPISEASSSLIRHGLLYEVKKILIYIFKKFRLARLKIKKRGQDSFLKEVSGVIHVGANAGQEIDLYELYSLEVVWIEPIPEIFEELKKNLIGYPKQRAFKYLLTDADDQEIEFKISNNNGASSSILDFGEHTDIWPEVHFTKSISLKSSTLASLVKRENIEIQKYQALIMDTQGSELLVLKGGTDLLKNFRYIKTEAPDFESYIGCCLVTDLSKFLDDFGFKEINRTKFAQRKEGGNYYNVVYERKI